MIENENNTCGESRPGLDPIWHCMTVAVQLSGAIVMATVLSERSFQCRSFLWFVVSKVWLDITMVTFDRYVEKASKNKYCECNSECTVPHVKMKN